MCQSTCGPPSFILFLSLFPDKFTNWYSSPRAHDESEYRFLFFRKYSIHSERTRNKWNGKIQWPIIRNKERKKGERKEDGALTKWWISWTRKASQDTERNINKNVISHCEFKKKPTKWSIKRIMEKGVLSVRKELGCTGKNDENMNSKEREPPAKWEIGRGRRTMKETE